MSLPNCGPYWKNSDWYVVVDTAEAPSCGAESSCIEGENTKSSAKLRQPHAPPPAAEPPFVCRTARYGNRDKGDAVTDRVGVGGGVPGGVPVGVTEAEAVSDGTPPMVSVAEVDGVMDGVDGGVPDGDAEVLGEPVVDGEGVIDGVGGDNTTLIV